MLYYKLYTILSSAWCNEDLRKLDKADFYADKITLDSFYLAEQDIRLCMDNFDSAISISYWKYLDFFKWSFGKPTANVLIVSSRMRKLIDENLILPPHRYYSCVINNYMFDQTSSDYFVLHFLYDFYENINYEKSEFGIIDIIKEKLISKIPFSIANSKLNIIAEYRRQKLVNRFYGVKPLKLVLKVEYDIVSVNTLICVSPKARQLFIDNNLTGIDFIPYASEKISSTTIPEIIYQNEV